MYKCYNYISKAGWLQRRRVLRKSNFRVRHYHGAGLELQVAGQRRLALQAAEEQPVDLLRGAVPTGCIGVWMYGRADVNGWMEVCVCELVEQTTTRRGFRPHSTGRNSTCCSQHLHVTIPLIHVVTARFLIICCCFLGTAGCVYAMAIPSISMSVCEQEEYSSQLS